MMNSISILPSCAAIAPAFAATFTDIVKATGALPYEIPGVARLGYPPAEHATEQLPPLIVLDGSPRPDATPDFPDVARLHDILDTKWSALTEGIDVYRIEVEGIAPRDVRLFSCMFKDKTPRELIGKHDGASLLHGFALILMQASVLTGGEQSNSLFFVAGALEACSGIFSFDTKMNMMSGSRILRMDKGFHELMEEMEIIPPAPRLNLEYGGAGAIAGEAYADAVRRNGGPPDFQNFLRHEAAMGWMHFLTINKGESPERAAIALNRAFNGAQVDPGGGALEGLFHFHAEAATFEERVRNVLRAGWAKLMGIGQYYPDGDDPMSALGWDEAGSHLGEAATLLRGEHPDVPKSEYEGAFPGVDKAGLALKAAGLAQQAEEIAAKNYEVLREMDDDLDEDDNEE